MTHRWFLAMAALGIGVATFFLIRSIDDDLVYYLYPSEAVAQRDTFPDGRRFRLAGIIIPGTLDGAGDVHTFDVSDGAARVMVRLIDTPPELFGEDVPVLLEGTWAGEVFEANQVVIRHDENYSAPASGNYPEPG